MGDLATLARVKNYIQPDTGDDDDVIADLIRYASGVIRTYTGRSLTTPAVTQQRAFTFTGRSSVRLDDKLSAITAITAPYPYERALLLGEYELQQFPTLSQLTIERPVEGRVQITGTWGWPSGSVPADIEYACVITVDEWYRGNILPSTGSRSEGEAESQNITLPEEVKEILAPWRPGMLIA